MKIRGFILAVALMFAVTLGFAPGVETAMTVHAADSSGVCSSCENIAWELEGTTLTISKVEGASSGDMCDECVNTFPKSVTKVIIKYGVTSIGYGAFSLTQMSLKDVEIPNSVTSIADMAFMNCIALSGITIPESVTSIGSSAFYNCREIQNITIPNSVSTIGYGAFSNCSNLKEAIVPCRIKEQVENINNNIFTQNIVITYTHPTIQNNIDKVTNTLYTSCACGEVKSSISLSEAPAKPHKITNVVSGVHVYWPAVEGIYKYGLWRSETGVNGTYKWIGNPTVAHFTDTKVESGKTYHYKVTLLNTNTNTHSAKSESIGITYVATPDITLRVNRAVGIGLGWDKIPGATGYAIYRKPYDGNSDWVRVATITDPNTLKWDDTSVKTANGTVYRYTIRALAGSDRKILSGCRATGRTMVRLTSRDLNSAVKTGATSIKCTWGTTTQATGYEVRFMVGDTVYKTYTIGNYKTGVKTFTDLKAGQTYKIQVRTYKKVAGVGSFYSAWSEAKYVKL